MRHLILLFSKSASIAVLKPIAYVLSYLERHSSPGKCFHTLDGTNTIYAPWCFTQPSVNSKRLVESIPYQNSITTSYSALVLFPFVHMVSLGIADESEKVGQHKYINRTIVFPNLCLLPKQVVTSHAQARCSGCQHPSTCNICLASSCLFSYPRLVCLSAGNRRQQRL